MVAIRKQKPLRGVPACHTPPSGRRGFIVLLLGRLENLVRLTCMHASLLSPLPFLLPLLPISVCQTRLAADQP